MHYVKRNFLAGRTPPQPVDELNRALWVWATHTAGQRVHGTTRERPLVRFQTVEQAALRPLPATPYDPAVWKQVVLHRDCSVCFAQAYYSAPFRLVGQSLWVRGGARTVERYTRDHQLVATPTRARSPGERQTHLDHLPPEKVPGLTLTREACRAHAAAIGPATSDLVESLLEQRPLDRLRVAGRVRRLAQSFSAVRLERACARAAHFGAGDYPTLKRILQEGLDQEPLAPASAAGAGGTLATDATPAAGRYPFVRHASEFVAGLFGGSGGTGGMSAVSGARAARGGAQ